MIYSLVFAVLLHVTTSAEKDTSKFRKETIAGFTVLIAPSVEKHINQKPLEALKHDLQVANKVLPKRFARLLHKQVPIHIFWDLQTGYVGRFIGVENFDGKSKRKTGVIEVARMDILTDSWVKKAPNERTMVHEIVHAIDFFALDEHRQRINSAFHQAIDRKLYDNVKDINGRIAKAYAGSNAKEYLAEISCTYLIEKSDYFPFQVGELKIHDPVGYKLMQTIWKP